MNDQELINHAFCALQEAYEYLEELSFSDSDIHQCMQKIQDCALILDSRSDDEDE